MSDIEATKEQRPIIPAAETNDRPLVELTHVEKHYGDLHVLKDINLTVRKGEVLVIVGPSGSGKSTMCRTINRLETIDSGDIRIDGKPLPQEGKELASLRAEVGMVFQSFNLFANKTILENVTLAPIKVRHMDKKAAEDLAMDLLGRVGVASQASKMPSQLSGGQQQRVAIARALVTGPAIICMDEPLSNLDAKLRVQLRNELKKMQKDFGITTIYVTHDQEEALTLSDRIAVFNSGVIEQVGTPNEVYNHSATEFVCNFIGDINRLGEGIVNELINMGAPVDPAKHNYIRLERIHVNVQPREGEIALDGTVESLEYYGLYIKYYITVCGQTIKVIEKNDGVNIYDAGQKVKAVFNPRDIMAYEPAAEAEVK